jgi:hypothetical protein
MEQNVQMEKFSTEIFNVSNENDDIEIVLNESLEAAVGSDGRRC